MFSGCSSTQSERVPEERVHEDIQRDYLVVDASSPVRPGWIEDAEIWSREHGRDTEAFRYFAFETDIKVSRSIACSLARANATADIAREISTFIDQSLVTSTYGDASIDENNPHVLGLRQYVQQTLAEKVQASVSGARVVKTYWEKRRHQKELGAQRDFTGWTCAAFIQMDADQLSRLIDYAVRDVYENASGDEAKKLAQKALSDANLSFQNLRTR